MTTIQTARVCATSVLGGLILTTAVQAEPPTHAATSAFMPAIHSSAGASSNLPVIANLLLIPGVDAYAKFSRGQNWPMPDISRPGLGDEQADWAYGAGLQYQLTPLWSLNADWDQFKLRSRDERSDVSRYRWARATDSEPMISGVFDE